MEVLFWVLVILNLVIGLSLLRHQVCEKTYMIISIVLPLALIGVYYYYGCNQYMTLGLLSIFEGLHNHIYETYITLLLLVNLFLLTLINVSKIISMEDQ